MTNKEKAEVTNLIEVATKVPKDKRAFILGYMQCMVDLNDKREAKRRKDIKNIV